MKKNITILTIILTNIFSFGQEKNDDDVEKGITQKKYEEGKLKEFAVNLFAMHYANTLYFKKNENNIEIKNGEDKHSQIKIHVKDKNQIKQFYYKNEEIVKLHITSTNLNALPANTTATTYYINQVTYAAIMEQNFERMHNLVTDDNAPNLSLKLFFGLEIPPHINTLDAIFEYIADFFSSEEAISQLFYEEDTIFGGQKSNNKSGYFITNASGKITDGILWKPNANDENEGKFEEFENEKVVQSEAISLKNFQKKIKKYLESQEED
nr:hypothetical protein [uncultured Flavobacterium sp.]